MAVDLASIINASSGTAFAIVGAFCLTLARRSRRATLVALVSLPLGLALAGSNLTLAMPWPPVYIALILVASVGAALLTVDLARGLPARSHLTLAAFAATFAIAFVAAVTGDRANGTLNSAAVNYGFSFAALALSLIGAACALRYATLPAQADPERRALAYLALAFGLYAFAWLAVEAARDGSGMRILLGAGFATMLAWIPATQGPRSALARNVMLGLGVAAVVGLVARLGAEAALASGLPGGVSGDFGVPGVARFFGIVFLVLAIVRHDFLGAPLPHGLVKGAPLGAVTLATLFVVAQILQNWLNAEFGLLIGGLLAGVALFVAHPIQRAAERLEKRTQGTASGSAASANSQMEQTYRETLRLALRNHQLTAAEEQHLFRLADGLGIRAGRAMELLQEVAAAAHLGRPSFGARASRKSGNRQSR